jgi:hypothetical protein
MKVIIEWSHPINFENYPSHNLIKENGIYQITRIVGKNEKLLYIGKAFNQTFEQRLDDHNNKWIDNYKGQIKLRLGLVSIYKSFLWFFSQEINSENHHFEDIESAFIFHCQPEHNTKKKEGYSFKNEFIIQNSGKYGFLPKEFNTKNL